MSPFLCFCCWLGDCFDLHCDSKICWMLSRSLWRDGWEGLSLETVDCCPKRCCFLMKIDIQFELGSIRSVLTAFADECYEIARVFYWFFRWVGEGISWFLWAIGLNVHYYVILSEIALLKYD